MYDGHSLNCGHYVSDYFDTITGIWWHCDDVNITEISDSLEGVYIRDEQKKTNVRLKNLLFVVYIRTVHLIKSIFFQE